MSININSIRYPNKATVCEIHEHNRYSHILSHSIQCALIINSPSAMKVKSILLNNYLVKSISVYKTNITFCILLAKVSGHCHSWSPVKTCAIVQCWWANISWWINSLCHAFNMHLAIWNRQHFQTCIQVGCRMSCCLVWPLNITKWAAQDKLHS